MKKLLFFVLLAGFALSVSAQDVKPKSGNNKVTKGGALVIDHIGPNGDLISTVWDPTALNAKISPNQLQVEVTNSKGQLVTGWDVCSLKKCKAVSVPNAKGAKNQITRENRTKVGKSQLSIDAQVVDLTAFGEGTYIVKAKSGKEVAETTIKIAKNGLARPEPRMAEVNKKDSN